MFNLKGFDDELVQILDEHKNIENIVDNVVNNIANSFCVPWNAALSSCFDKSKLISFPPTNNCITIEAVTIGPIPKVSIEPKLPASTDLNCAN